jgi:hypothetical protein
VVLTTFLTLSNCGWKLLQFSREEIGQLEGPLVNLMVIKMIFAAITNLVQAQVTGL